MDHGNGYSHDPTAVWTTAEPPGQPDAALPKVINLSPLAVTRFLWRTADRRAVLTVCVRACFALRRDDQAQLTDHQWPSAASDRRPGAEQMRAAMVELCDTSPVKPRADILVSSATPTRAFGVAVSGWHKEGLADGRPPDLGPVPASTRATRLAQPASALAWLSEWPSSAPAPAGFDFRLFNLAPGDQQVDVLDGPLVIAWEGLHRAHAHYRTELPVVLPDVVANLEHVGDGIEVAMRCDTLWLDVERERAVLWWRGCLPLGDAPCGLGDTLVVALHPPAWDSRGSAGAHDNTEPHVTVRPEPAVPFVAGPATDGTDGSGSLALSIMPETDPHLEAGDTAVRFVSGDPALPFTDSEATSTGSADPVIDLETWASLGVALAFHPEERDDRLRVADITNEQWLQACHQWRERIQAERRRGGRSLRADHDAAVVAAVEGHRGRLRPEDYAALEVARERGCLTETLRALALPSEVVAPVRRAWLERMFAEPAVRSQVRDALRRARGGDTS